MPPAPRSAHEALAGRVALRLTAELGRSADALPHDIGERLRVARERAVATARSHRRAPALAVAAAVVPAGAGRAALSGMPPLWWRLVSVLPLLLLLLGLVLLQHRLDAQQISAAAEIDSALLADELPPAAYRDPGFQEFLRNAEAP
ncbi:MAG: DUF3619 family protein [Burkholderiaceae bacterium]|nr:DUF3619 family protein [Burkholderiaceae bacterium]